MAWLSYWLRRAYIFLKLSLHRNIYSTVGLTLRASFVEELMNSAISLTCTGNTWFYSFQECRVKTQNKLTSLGLMFYHERNTRSLRLRMPYIQHQVLTITYQTDQSFSATTNLLGQKMCSEIRIVCQTLVFQSKSINREKEWNQKCTDGILQNKRTVKYKRQI